MRIEGEKNRGPIEKNLWKRGHHWLTEPEVVKNSLNVFKLHPAVIRLQIPDPKNSGYGSIHKLPATTDSGKEK